jgi:hypothetical protein
MTTLTLRSAGIEITFDALTGALTGIKSPATNWQAIHRPQLGLSFQMLVPTRAATDWHAPGRRNNLVLGQEQKLSRAHADAGGRAATFTWNRLIDQQGTELDIALTLTVRLDDEAAVFGAMVENRSPFVVENLMWPYMGDLRAPDGATSMDMFAPGYADPRVRPLWPRFQNAQGYYGVDYPSMLSKTAWCLLRCDSQGLYVGVDAPRCEPVMWHAELRPGYSCAMHELVPSQDVIADKPVTIRFAASHMPFVQPGESRQLPPVAVAPYRGTWHHGVDIHKRRAAYPPTAQTPQWLRRPHSWQQIQMNSPEDELRFAFRNIPQVARECARHGVAAIQLVGWNDGGQDQGNPSHDPDPRLGTPEELRQAIAQCHALGVKVILFAKFTWADEGTQWFRDDLHRLATKDPYGHYHHYAGYQYQTQTQLSDVSTKRLIPMCFLSEEYLKLCRQEFRKMVKLGAAGILYDESQHHGPAYLCFDTSHGHRPGAPVYANDLRLIRELSKDTDEQFLFAGEACYDLEFAVYHLAYFRTWNPRHIPVQRYLRPDAKIATAVTGFNDRNMINQCLLYGYVVSYEPLNFKGRLGDFPQTVAYGRQMDSLRAELAEYFWDGEFRHEVGARATGAGGTPHHPFAVWRRSDGRLGVAVANYSMEQAVAVEVSLDGGQPLEKYRIVGQDQWQSVVGGVQLPAMSAAVVL